MLRRRGATILACFMLLSHYCEAGNGLILRNVEIKGNKEISDAEILKWLGLQRGSSYHLQGMPNNIAEVVRKYREEGFYRAAIDSVSTAVNADSTEFDFYLRVREGERTELGALAIRGNKAISTEEILHLFDTRVGRPLLQAQLERDILLLLKKYEGIGYPFARVEVDSLGLIEEEGRTKFRIDITVTEGSKTTIEEVKIEGNKDTKDNVIFRELRIALGEVYNDQKVEAGKRRLEKLNLFSSVSEPELYVTPKGGGLLVKVQEGNSNSFDGIVGYLPKGGSNPSGYFTGFVNVSMRNLFGTARRLAVRWQREDQETQEIELRYVEPWVLDFPMNAGIGFLQREQDSSYVRRRFDFRADLLATEELSLGLILSQDRVIPSSNLLTPVVSESRTSSVGGEIRYDSRDDGYSPTSGVYYRSNYSIGRKTFSPSSPTLSIAAGQDAIVKRLGVDLEFYFEPFLRQVVGTGLHARDLRSDHIEDADLYRFGGTNTLRGYRENQFLGSSIAWSNFEYRFLLARRSYFYGFFDAGYYFRPAEGRRGIASADGLRTGYGIGFRVETSLGLLGVSYALGRGDSFNSGKIHFGVVNQF
jgi:outer membrane protein insertion porin family